MSMCGTNDKCLGEGQREEKSQESDFPVTIE